MLHWLQQDIVLEKLTLVATESMTVPDVRGVESITMPFASPDFEGEERILTRRKLRSARQGQYRGLSGFPQ